MFSQRNFAAVCTVALTLGGCAALPMDDEYGTQPSYRSPQSGARAPSGSPPADDQTQLALAKPPSSTAPSRTAPVQNLLTTAEHQIASGQLDAAVATLERALRVEPRNGEVWHRMATVRLQQSQFDQAAQLAAKSNLYAANDPRLQARNWRLIGQVRERNGDQAGASSAYANALRLEQ